MTDEEIQGVRRFKRQFSERIGSLTDRFLGRARPMGEARVLWEIGPNGTEVRAVRARLALDSAYTSRVLRSLEQQSLVTFGPSPHDRRVRRIQLTAAGARRTRGTRSTLRRRRIKDPGTPERQPTCTTSRGHGRS